MGGDERFEPNRLLNEVKWKGGMTLGGAIGFFLVPIIWIKIIGFLFFVAAAPQLLHHGSTLIAVKLDQPALGRFQSALTFALPLALTFYFIGEARAVDIGAISDDLHRIRKWGLGSR